MSVALPALSITTGPLGNTENKKKEAERLRRSIEVFVEAATDNKYSLAELLNESFTLEMMDLLFKRMTSKLRSLLFARQKTLDMIRIALDPTLSDHTRMLATNFIVVGGAANSLVTCPADDHSACAPFWDTFFVALQREADGASALSRHRFAERRASVAELEEIIKVEVKVMETVGAESHQQSEQQQQAEQATESSSSDDGNDEDAEEVPTSPASRRSSLADQPTTPSDHDKPYNAVDAALDMSVAPPVDDARLEGIFSSATASFAAQILRYFAVRGQKGACIFDYMVQNGWIVDLLLANLGHDDIRTLLLHVIYSDHTEEAMESLFATGLMGKMVQKLVTFAPPRNVYDRDCIENTFVLLREIIHAPYLTARGVAISAKVIPLDKVTGQDEYISICGASREMANSSLRKYTSRKVRRLIHLFMQNRQQALEQLFVQMIKELTFWSSPVVSSALARRSSVASMSSLALLSQGHPRPVCTSMLTHLFELTESVDFTELPVKSGPPASGNAATTSVGIDCLNFMCSTHLVRAGRLLLKKKLKNELQACQVSVNCMMGLRITSLREEQNSRTSALESGFAPSQGNQTIISLDEIDSVQSCDWHTHGFSITVKKTSSHSHHAASSSAIGVFNEDPGSDSGHEVKTVEYFAANSEQEKKEWIKTMKEVISGDLNALEIFCSDDWRGNVREYRRLRECLITCMERKGHELMVFLKQVVVFNTRKASGYQLWAIVKCLNAALSNESKRLDRMFITAQLLAILIACYEKYPMWSLLLGEITKLLIFCFGDFKNKRSRKCPLIERLLLSEGPDARLLPLLKKTFLDNDDKNGFLAGTDALSNLKLLMESIKLCYNSPKTRSQQRVQLVLKTDPEWVKLLSTVRANNEKNPGACITSIPSPPLMASTSPGVRDGLQVAPTQPAFQEAIIHQITRPSYSTAHGFGSSFLLGDGCAFGYLFKERKGGREWQKALVVYEFVSYKLWYFYPSEVDEAHRITWKWVVPLSVRTRYTHGHDETHSSVGHHGLFITAYQHLSGSEHHASTREMHFSVTKLEDRDLWKGVLSKAASTIQKLSKDYSTMAVSFKKKPDKKSVTNCQEPSCGAPFKLFRRPHACKRCGKWMCGKCTQQRMCIPEVGLLTPVRHCRKCFDAAGGGHAEGGPTNLFRLSASGSELSGSAAAGPQLAARSTSISNSELYELAHGMISPQTLMNLRQREDSIDSPTNYNYRVDEVDGDLDGRKGFGKDDVDDIDESPCSTPMSLSTRSLMIPKEDTRG